MLMQILCVGGMVPGQDILAFMLAMTHWNEDRAALIEIDPRLTSTLDDLHTIAEETANNLQAWAANKRAAQPSGVLALPAADEPDDAAIQHEVGMGLDP